MGKITVKHYLNKRLRPSFINGVFEYPVYLRVSYGRKNERVKSDWIVHTCSEHDFHNDIHIIELKQYESEIVSDIVKQAGDKEFNLSARLSHSKNNISDIFLGYMFDKHEIKNQIIDYVSIKADISKSILNPYFNTELHYYQWTELYEKEIFNDKTKEKIIYLSMLLEFEEINYPLLGDNVFGYRAGCIFVFHEWENRNKETDFIRFAESKNILSLKQLKEITKKFNSMLLLNNMFDLRIE